MAPVSHGPCLAVRLAAQIAPPCTYKPDAAGGVTWRAFGTFRRLNAGARRENVLTRDTRREENQKLFRAQNERLHDFVVDAVNDWTRVPFLCECAAEFCDGRVEVRLEQWEVVAAQPNRYLMVAGHLRSEGEQVIGSVGEYDVVEKPDKSDSGSRERVAEHRGHDR